MSHWLTSALAIRHRSVAHTELLKKGARQNDPHLLQWRKSARTRSTSTSTSDTSCRDVDNLRFHHPDMGIFFLQYSQLGHVWYSIKSSTLLVQIMDPKSTDDLTKTTQLNLRFISLWFDHGWVFFIDWSWLVYQFIPWFIDCWVFESWISIYPHLIHTNPMIWS